MTLQWIAILLGVLAIAGGVLGLVRSELLKKQIVLFPRSTIPAWILTALCCWLGAKEALGMNMGFLDVYKKYIFLISPAVFFACVIYMKELLAPRALGGFLLLIAVPILRTAALSGKPYFQVITTVVYLWIIYGLVLLMSPWYFRKIHQYLLDNEMYFKGALFAKIALGILFIFLGFSVYV
jgi:hypothetical protein